MKLTKVDTNRLIFEKFNSIITPSKQEMFQKIASERTRFMTVVMEEVYQSHNASAVMRTCDCFGIQDLHAIESKNDYKAHDLISKGSKRWVDLIHHRGQTATASCLQSLKEKNYRIIATTPHGNSQSIFDMDVSRPMAFVFGTEGKGISEKALQNADETVYIPMVGFTESLNVSVSVAIILNIIRQRLNQSNIDWKLTEEEQIETKIKWCKSILNGGEYMYERFLQEVQTEGMIH